MLPINELVRKLCPDVSVIVAGFITDTMHAQKLTPQATAFFAANLCIDSDWLGFRVEPWAPDALKHQQLYDSPIFGNTCPADAELYRARGFGRVVGRANYLAFSRWSGFDCINDPTLLEDGLVSYRSWEWLWTIRGGVQAAIVAQTDFDRAVRQLIGWPDRITHRYTVYKRNMLHDYS